MKTFTLFSDEFTALGWNLVENRMLYMIYKKKLRICGLSTHSYEIETTEQIYEKLCDFRNVKV
jgi:hypothetical protein